MQKVVHTSFKVSSSRLNFRSPYSLQAFIRGDVEVLKDWCHEGVSIFLNFDF